MKKTMNLIICCFFMILAVNSFASINNSQPGKQFFDGKNAATQLATKPDMNIKSLNSYIDKIEALQGAAKVCVSKSDDQLKAINELLKETRLEHALKLSQSDYKYFQDKKLFYAKQRSECRLFLYQSKEVLLHYKDTLQRLSAYKILKRTTPVSKIHEKEILLSLKNLNIRKIYSVSGIEIITGPQLLVGLVLFALAILVAVYVRTLCIRWFSKHAGAHPSILSLIATLSVFVIPITVFGFIGIFLHIIFFKVPSFSLLESMNQAILIFIGLFALSRYLFYPPRNLPNFIKLPSKLGKSFHKRVVTLAVWVLVGYFVAVIFMGQDLNRELIELVRALFITVLSGLTVWLFWLFCKIPKIEHLNYSVTFLIKAGLSILFLVVVLAEGLGYHHLAIFIILGVMLTVILLVLVIGLWRFIDIIYQLIDDNKYVTARKIRQLFGIKLHRKLSEIVLIKFVGYVVLVGAFFIGVMKIWSVPVNIIDVIEDALLNGFTIVGLKIVPLSILVALISFAFIVLAGRFIATTIVKKQQFEGEEETQVAVASIVVYIAFALALLFALLIIGVNFTGLAIIAGALSVGIGLGLQNIVNNFVSGIILLLEKPVKSGDRVIVGNTEGFIKKIRIRSTQITTLAKEDVIVPNADLITNQVTNYMFRDRYWRVVCKVGVAYGSDIELVKKVLVEVARKHSDILQGAPNQPTVLFRDFGDSSLLFELWCIIHDVNKKFIVASDLNFAINAAFRQHGITIAFPQRDVHIKENIIFQQPE